MKAKTDRADKIHDYYIKLEEVNHDIDLVNSTLYTTLFPCLDCYELAKKLGIRKFVTKIPSEEHIERWGKSWEIVKERAIIDEITIEYID